MHFIPFFLTSLYMNKIDSVGYEMLSEISKNTNYFIQVITIAIAAPIVEELLFRGLVSVSYTHLDVYKRQT